ncbi:response regulator [Virgibacillus pantothenticus]|uniref:response regulator n=1 Tax=Virgibacillus pantothenticus TaxID=1473 RepID=UPI003D2D214C
MKAILVDDEKLALDYLEQQINKVGRVEVIGKFTNPVHAHESILKEDVDVLFLDIQLPEINGMRLAEKVLENKPNLTIVFVTAYDKYAVKAFELNAVDYLLKPIPFDRLKKTVERIENQYNQQSTIKETSPLYVNVLGQFSVETVRGQPEFVSWRTKKAAELFLYLLHQKGKMVRKSFLIDLLWPDVELERVSALLYTTIYYVRKTLRKYQKHLRLENVSDGYVLETENIILDFNEWKEKIKTLPPLSQTSINAYIQVMSLYKGGYLQGYDFWWAESERYYWEQIWLTKAMEIARFYQDNHDIAGAKLWYSHICKYYPEMEKSHFALMKIYAFEDNPALVHQQYESLKTYLQDELGVKPNSEIVAWYEAWKNGKLASSYN